MTINLTSITSTNISGLRTEFKDLCGIPDMTNTEIDKWLNRGIKFLDQLTDFQYGPARQAIVIAADTWRVEFLSDCRILREVYLINIEDGRNIVVPISHQDFNRLYPNIPDTDAGLPEACTLAIARAANTVSAIGGAATYDDFTESKVDGASFRALLFNCKTDQEYQLEMFGKFYSIPVSDTAEDNWWVLNYSETVLAAALYKMQLVKFKNREAAADYMAEITGTVTQLNNDQAEEDSVDVTRMES